MRNFFSKKIGFLFRIALFVSVFLALFAAVFFLYISPKISDRPAIFKDNGKDRNYHILVVGQADNSVFLNQVYEGAKSLSEAYSAIVDLKVPNSLAEDVSLQQLIEYASFVNADGIIAYFNSQDEKITTQYRIDGSEIPLIAIGQYLPENPQISYIGNNYFELGRRIAMESSSLITNDSTAFLMLSGELNTPNYGYLLKSLKEVFNVKKITNYVVLDGSKKDNERFLLKNLTSNSIKDPILICLTEEDTMNAIQIVSTISSIFNPHIIGFGDNDTIKAYLKKGVIIRQISLDPWKIGRIALRELFEYRNTGYANSYISADIRVIGSDSEF